MTNHPNLAVRAGGPQPTTRLENGQCREGGGPGAAAGHRPLQGTGRAAVSGVSPTGRGGEPAPGPVDLRGHGTIASVTPLDGGAPGGGEDIRPNPGPFNWPGIKKEIEYCRHCEEFQLHSPHDVGRSPLIPHPIILVLLDYATRYPEAVPLRTATGKAVTRNCSCFSAALDC